MSFGFTDFVDRVRPRSGRPGPATLSGSILDPGSPQYVRPEDLFLDIQAQLFNVPRVASKDIKNLDPADFGGRWREFATGRLADRIRRIGDVSDDSLLESLAAAMRSPRRKHELHPTLQPLVVSLAYYKSISPKLPSYLDDQLRPALFFADTDEFLSRLSRLQDCLRVDDLSRDVVKVLAQALLPPDPSYPPRYEDKPYKGPALRNYCDSPSKPVSVCKSFAAALDSMVELAPKVPRLMWTRWMTAVLRTWLPLFFLRRCLVTHSTAAIARAVLAGEPVPSSREIAEDILCDDPILRGSRQYLSQIAPLVQKYVRARLELSVLLDLSNLYDWLNREHNLRAEDSQDREQILRKLEELEPGRLPAFSGFMGRTDGFVLAAPGDPNYLGVDEWLRWVHANRLGLGGMAKIIAGNDSALALVDGVYQELRPAYEPLSSGFGKNAHEYVAFTLGAPRKADRDPEFPDEFNLIYRGEGGQTARRVVVSPGPQLMVLLVQLVCENSKKTAGAPAKLGDLLDLFDSLGVDFRSQPEDFEGLKNELLRIGLLQSSADAAEAASLKPAYTL